MWAKSRNDDGDWLPLYRHMSDAAAITGWLFDEFIPAAVRDRIAAAVDGDRNLAGRLVRFLAAVHDVGKATPTFAGMPGVDLDGPIRSTGLRFPSISPIE
jgi:hypothetical protein